MLGQDEGGHIVHGELVDQRLIVLGVVALIVDEGEILLNLADQALHPLADGREGGGKSRGIHRITFVEVRVTGGFVRPGPRTGPS